MHTARALTRAWRAPVAARTVATWSALIFTVGCTLVVRTLIARILGPVGIGLYALMLTSAWLAGTVLTIGLPAYNASFASRQSPAVLLANSLAWNGVWLVVLSLACTPLLLSAGISLPSKLLIVGVVGGPLLGTLDCTRGILQGTSAIAAYNWLGLSGGLLNVAVVGTLALTSRLSLRTAVAGWVVSNAISAVAAVVVSSATGGLTRPDAGTLWRSFRFGAQAWLSQLTGILNFRIALLLTQVLLGTAAVGLYSIAITIAEILFYLPNALAAVTVSRYAEASHAEARALLRRSTLWVLAINTACAVAGGLLGLVLIPRIFGPSYIPSSHLLLMLLPGVIAYTPVAISNWYFNAHLQRPSVNLLVGAVSAAANGGLTLLLAPRFGLPGVAWAATSGYICGSLLNLMLIRQSSPARAASAVPAAGWLRRLTFRVLSGVDYGIAGVLYFTVPRRIRAGWVAPGTVLRNQRAHDEITALLDGAPRALILDVGGGIAALGELAHRQTRLTVVTLDISLELLQRAKAKIPGSILVCGDGTRLPFGDDAFDAVVMVHSLEHIPEQIRPALAAEIKRVSRRGVVIHGPAGQPAVELAQRFIEALVARGGVAPVYAIEHIELGMPTPEWLSATFPGCELTPRRNLQVELSALLTGYTPIVRWFGGIRSRRWAAQDDRAPFVEWTMRWRKPAVSPDAR